MSSRGTWEVHGWASQRLKCIRIAQGPLKYRVWCWGGAWDSAFLASSQRTAVLLVQGPHFGDDVCKECRLTSHLLMECWGALGVPGVSPWPRAMAGMFLGKKGSAKKMYPKGPPGSTGRAQVSSRAGTEACGARTEVDCSSPGVCGEQLSATRLRTSLSWMRGESQLLGKVQESGR